MTKSASSRSQLFALALSSTPRPMVRPIPWVGFLGFAMLLMLNLVCWSEWWVWHGRRLNAEGRVHNIAKTHRGLAQGIPKQIAALERIALARRFGWSVFLSRLEAVVPPRISIEQILPSFETGDVQLQGYAVGEDDLVEFLTHLRASPYFTKVPPVPGEQKWTPDGKLMFPVTFHYRMESGTQP